MDRRAVVIVRAHEDLILGRHHVVVKFANLAVCGAEIHGLLVCAQHPRRNIGPEIPLVAVVAFVLVAVRDISASVHNKNIPPAPGGGHRIRKAVFLGELRIDTSRPAE